MIDKVEFEKIIYVLKDIYKKTLERKWLSELIVFSEFEFRKHWNTTLPPEIKAYNITIHTGFDVYTKYFGSIKEISKIILDDINKISELTIGEVIILPDYDKIEIVNSEIHPVYTQWEEINIGQLKLIEQLKAGSSAFDFQNIGNTSRSLLQILSNLVFEPSKHVSNDKSIDYGPSKFKNRLHSYIKTELSGSSNEALRQFAESSIVTVEKAIDLANAVTHKIEAERAIAEVCVIATVSVISIIKIIKGNSI